MQLTQIIYHSHVAGDVRSRLDLLRAVLSVSRKNNARDEITGFLILDEDVFFQVLEGEPERVSEAYRRIEKDPRHAQVTLVARREIRRRSFPRWSMGGAIRTLDQREIFLGHGISGRLDPARLSAPTILALAMDLQDHASARRLVSDAA